ncbi:Hsp70 protein-domain-containing protein [Entophlyctis helioformis]|nr:Hsp70 protein-domain-containing protein [Entophlyctis helioformis]
MRLAATASSSALAARASTVVALWLAMLALLLSAGSPHSAGVSATVIGVDYGTDWLKVSVVKPGGVLETVLNRESKRKTSAVVNLRSGVRTYGSEAVSLGMRFPEVTYTGLKPLLGKRFTDPEAAEFRSTFPNVMTSDAARGGTIAFEATPGEVFAVEELVAMILAHAKQQAASYGEVAVSGAVITVPPYFTHFERQALLDAAEIADLKVLALTNDETAVAVNYALGKRYPEPKNIVFYDMGAGSTVVSLVTFKTSATKSRGAARTLLEVQVKATGGDQALGGHFVDVRVQQHLAKKFMEINKSSLGGASIFENTRAMARLLKEANRVKHILSANQDVFASVENLFEGLDFRTKVTRKELEDLCQDLFARVAKPLDDVLASAQLSLSDIEAVVLVGGGVRIPAIQAALGKAVGEDKIARNVDGDEAAVHGAVFHAASISAQFRLGLDLKIKDLVPVPIVVLHETEGKDGAAPVVTKTPLFNATATLGSKKLMTFKRTEDFSFTLGASGADFVSIAKVQIKGLAEATTKLKDRAIAPPKVKVLFELTESGTVVVKDAYATFEVDGAAAAAKEKGSVVDKVLSFFGKGDKNAKTAEESEGEEPDVSEEEPAAEKSKPKDKAKKAAKDVKGNATVNATANATAADAAEAKKSVFERAKLQLTIDWETVRPMSKDEKAKARARMLKMDTEDRKREEREAARNKFESFLYRCKEFTWDDDSETYTKPEELEAFKASVAEHSEWLDDHSESADVADFKEHNNALVPEYMRLSSRKTQDRERPEMIAKYLLAYKTTQELRDKFAAIKGPDGKPLYTDEELKTFEGILTEEDEWYTKTSEAQKGLAVNEDSVLTVIDLENHAQRLELFVEFLNEEHVKKLAKAKPTPTPKPKTKKTTTSTTAPESASASASASASEAAAEPSGEAGAESPAASAADAEPTPQTGDDAEPRSEL